MSILQTVTRLGERPLLRALREKEKVSSDLRATARNASRSVLRKIADRVRSRVIPPNGFSGVFSTFDEANRGAPVHLPRGYDTPETASFYGERLEHVNFDDYPALFWFERALNDSRTIVEIGGHVGVAYYTFERAVPYPEDLRWTIVDVPAVTEAGAKLAEERKRSNLHFVNKLEVAGAFDILMASGSLQYLPPPLLPERIHALAVLPRHIIINTTPVTESAGYVTLQNLGVTFCPYHIHSYRELIEPLLEVGYELIDSWKKNRKVTIPGHADRTVDHYSGYYLRLSREPSLERQS
jgi:putative methyltransferase (TIGR04325 family)